MRIVEFKTGIAIHGTFPESEVIRTIIDKTGKLPLVIADPPYGNIVDEVWDRIEEDDKVFCQWMISWTREIQKMSLPGAALYVWGGVGLPGERKTEGCEYNKPPFRPFLRYLVEVELQTEFQLSTPITWKKKRAYGIQWGYLFTREELAYLVLGAYNKPRKFTIPLLSTKRGYAGYNEKYPAKSEYLRRTNVWDDITEILKDKKHINQKPVRLMEIPIETHTEPGEWVLDPFAGSGTTALAAIDLDRKFVVVEQDEGNFDRMVEFIKTEESETNIA
jgi:site-specific DNA-methyltransferase (adenine-specific)